MPRRPRSLGDGALIAMTVAGCGAGAGVGAGGRHVDGVVVPTLAAGGDVSPPVPAGWGRLRLPSGAVLPDPPGWPAIDGDRGSASAALYDPDGGIRAYLNATPADRHERFAGWVRFRIRHNVAEGDREVRLISSRSGVRLGAGRPSCVVDEYAGVRFGAGRALCVLDEYATSRSRYRELACIFAPANGSRATVLVAAARPNVWARERRLLDFALEHFTS